MQVRVHVQYSVFHFLTHTYISYTLTGGLHKHLHSISKSGRKERNTQKKKGIFFNGKQQEENRESRAGEFSEIYIIYLLHKSVSCERGRYGKYFCFVNCACGLNWRN